MCRNKIHIERHHLSRAIRLHSRSVVLVLVPPAKVRVAFVGAVGFGDGGLNGAGGVGRQLRRDGGPAEGIMKGASLNRCQNPFYICTKTVNGVGSRIEVHMERKGKQTVRGRGVFRTAWAAAKAQIVVNTNDLANIFGMRMLLKFTERGWNERKMSNLYRVESSLHEDVQTQYC